MSTVRGHSGKDAEVPVLGAPATFGEGGSTPTGIPPLRQRARNDGLTTDTRQEKRQLAASPMLVPTQWWVGAPGTGGGST
jgi:hypothetical protein